MGIFELVCPSCGEVNSVDASTCQCGHIFSAVTGSYEAAKLTLQEEEAYLEYIRARLEQLKTDKKFAKSDVEAHPGNRDKEHALELIRQEIADLKAQYTEQKTKIVATRKVNEELRAQMEKEAAEAKAKAEAEALRLKKEKEKAEALKRAKEEAARKKAAAEEKARQEAKRKVEEALARKMAEEEARKKAAEEKRLAEAAARKKAEEQKRTEQAAQLEAERKQKEELAQKKRAEAERLLAEAERIKRENEEAVAASDEIKRRAGNKKKNTVPDAGAFKQASNRAAVARPEPELNSETDLAAAAEEIEQPAVQECPICTAELPLEATECRCGYKFETSASDMPSLSTGDFFAAPEQVGDEEMQECPVCTAELPASATKCKCGYELTKGESTMPGLSLDGGLKD